MPKLLTLQQVKEANKFAWDEFMNLYLPGTGFVGFAPPDKAPVEGEEAPQFIPHSSSMLRDSGWHHLDGCDCKYCRP